MATTSLPDEHPDLVALKKINDYLSKVSYALKAPVRRIYTRDPMHGGRLYVPLQNLPNSIIKIRINTLIDGKQVCEIDLSANHARIGAALNGRQLPKDPYQTIADKAGVSRLQVKFLINKAIGAPDRRISLHDDDQTQVITHEEKARINNVTEELFPELYSVLYKGMGVVYQSLEGDILLKTMIKLIELDIPSLPIHDAIMVQQGNEHIAQKILEETWMEEVNTGIRTFTKISYP